MISWSLSPSAAFWAFLAHPLCFAGRLFNFLSLFFPGPTQLIVFGTLSRERPRVPELAQARTWVGLDSFSFPPLVCSLSVSKTSLPGSVSIPGGTTKVAIDLMSSHAPFFSNQLKPPTPSQLLTQNLVGYGTYGKFEDVGVHFQLASQPVPSLRALVAASHIRPGCISPIDPLSSSIFVAFCLTERKVGSRYWTPFSNENLPRRTRLS